MRIICIYAGRFQPFHKSHYAVYSYLVSKFGKKNVYIATSNKTLANSPFNFKLKLYIITTMFGIPASNIINSNSNTPYKVLTLGIDAANTILVYAVTLKDVRLQTGKYFKGKLPPNPKPATLLVYTLNVPLMSNKIMGALVSGTSVRELFKSDKLNLNLKKKVFTELFGKFNLKVFKLIMLKIGGSLALGLLRFNNQGLTRCLYCNEYFKQISRLHLLYKHSVDIVLYRKSYPVISLQLKNKGQLNPMSNPIVKEKHMMAVNSKEYKEVQRIGSTGRKLSDESKKKLSLNNSMNSLINRKKVSLGVKASYTDLLRSIRSKDSTRVMNENKLNIAAKMILKGLWLDPKFKSLFLLYKLNCHKATALSYKTHFYSIPLALLRSREFHLDHKYSISNGFKHSVPPEIIGHYKNLLILHHSLNESKFIKNSISLYSLILDIRSSKQPLDERILLLCGGASGHMRHPFDDSGLTFNDFKTIINRALMGKLDIENLSTMKYDGQNIQVSWKDGRLVGARNKGHQKNFGLTSLDILGMKAQFAGRGAIQEAFVFAMMDLQRAFSKFNAKQLMDIFGNGKRWIALLIIYPKTRNVIPYDKSLIIFHNITLVNLKGLQISVNPTGVKDIYSIIVSVNADVQKHFGINPPTVVTMPKVKDFSKRRAYFMAKLDNLQSKYGLSGKSTLGDYNDAYWNSVIDKVAKSASYQVPKSVRDGLIARWSRFDKSYSLNQLKLDVNNLQFLNWAYSFDKTDHAEAYKKNSYDWEVLFLLLGALIMTNLSNYMIVNPDAAIQKLRTEILNTADLIRRSGNVGYIDKLLTQLKRLNAVGGIKSIVPTEGIVFTYKGNLYKATGTFADINQILGMMKYAR